MEQYILIMVPWDEYYRNEQISCFLDIHGKCMDDPSFDDDESYLNFFDNNFISNPTNGVTVFYAAKKTPKNKTVIVGWYKNALIYKHAQYDIHSDSYYRVICDIENAFLLPLEERNHVINIKFNTYFVPSGNDLINLREYMEYCEKHVKRLDILLSITDIFLQKKTSPEALKELISEYEKTRDRSLLPKIHGHATEWANREPTEATAWDYKGYALINLFWPREALECFDRVLKIDPNHYKALLDKGRCLIFLERYREAIEFFNDVHIKYPLEDIVKLNLSDAYYFAGFQGLSYRWLKEIKDEFIKKI